MKPAFNPRQETIDPFAQPEGDTLTIDKIDDQIDDGDTDKDGYRVLLYNDDHTPADAVVEQLIKATQCSLNKAIKIMDEAHRKGRAICYRGAKSKCQQVAKVLREIRLQCEVDCD